MFENLRRIQFAGHRSYETPPSTPDERYRSSNPRNSRELTTGYFRKPTPERAESPPPQPLRSSLTQSLLEASPEQLEAATQHPFLRQAGEGRLSKQKLSCWLSQDRLYAEAYVSFITSLIARVTLPYAFVADKSKSLRWQILNLLTGCLTNIQREIDFFTSTAKEYDLQLDLSDNNDSEYFGPNEITEQYITLFRSFHLDPQQTLLEGLLILWATEKCYLEAWTHASTFLSKDEECQDDADGGALRNTFIPNWSSEEFGTFVQDIADVTDELAQREGALRKIEVFKALWLHVLEIEKGFWPEIDTQE